jgi:RNA polymerase sigma-70 factor (ECF subfamily)
VSEAIGLARALVQLMPGGAEAVGLLALMLLHDARRGARVDDAGDLVRLEDQDRSRWNRLEIAAGVTLLAGSAGLLPEISPKQMLTPFTSQFILMM